MTSHTDGHGLAPRSRYVMILTECRVATHRLGIGEQ